MLLDSIHQGMPQTNSPLLSQYNVQFNMCVIRCMVLVLMVPEIGNFAFKETFESVIALLYESNRYLRNFFTQKPKFLEELAGFKACELIQAMMPQKYLLDVVHDFQSYITIVIMENIFQ
mmetsp:Transcript_6557/g.10536  ORF Transcript_6557/g.10536 Transcript_6557/m.10536 type:complete len:119 (-) Transcript_6557:1456-1812(-)